MKKNTRSVLSVAAAAALFLGGCAIVDASGPGQAKQQLSVVTTFSILEDIVKEVGGDDVSVHSIVPLGTDPHEYQPLPDDVSHTAEADVIIWNGLNMELGDGWLESLLDTTGSGLDDEHVVEASVGVEPMYLSDGPGSEHEVNPHAFLDPNVGMIYTKNIRDGLISADPDHAENYAARAESYLEKLAVIDREYTDTVATIPPAHRTFVTSENAFQYMNDRYGLQGLYIWAIDTGDLGSPAQVSTLIEELKNNPVPALFVESNVDTRPMETVASETTTPIFGEVFSDELGGSNTNGATYLEMLRFNIKQIGAGLGAAVDAVE
ncbi:metal ABC transporter solute-binding protein, Zn/Mn family [Leucobacter sp. HY1908]